MMNFSPQPVFTVPVTAGVRDSPIGEKEPVASVTFSPDNAGGITCTEVIPPAQEKGDPCEYVRSTLKPTWAGSQPSSFSQYPLLIVGSGDKMRAIAPNGSVASANFSGTERQRSKELIGAVLQPGDRIGDLMLLLKIAPNGSVSDCRVTRSAGSDAGDVAACRVMKKEIRALAGRDVFGRPLPESEVTWTVSLMG